jgi:DNA invertase Pin-like site-specific DNA recombinase
MDTMPAPAVPVAILVRVSTQRQTTERQIHELRAVADARGWSVIEVVEEDGVSGSAKDADRHGLARVEGLAAAGAIQKVLTHEISRVGRRPALVHGFVERLLDLKVSLYWHSQRCETMLPSGKRNPAAGMMLAVLAEMALAERETLRERIVSGLEAARRRGRTLGRPVGTVMPPEALLAKHADVVRLLRAGKSLRDVAARIGKGVSTVKRIRALLRAEKIGSDAAARSAGATCFSGG